MQSATSDPSITKDIPVPIVYPLEGGDSEFMRKYPPDTYGDEASENARVWRVYRDEATNYDQTLLDGWHKTLDILLIFAGLFSSVVTGLVIESYTQLQPDYTQFVATTLFAIVQNASSPVPVLAPSAFQPSSLSLWTNGLWFTSLMISLSVSLLCILAKQWLGEYQSQVSNPAPSLAYWARRHAFFQRGLRRWNISAFIATLPVLLHLALFLFLAGLSAFLWSISTVIAVVISMFGILLFVFYLASTVLPILSDAAATRTHFTAQLHDLVNFLRRGFYLIRMSVISSLATVLHSWSGNPTLLRFIDRIARQPTQKLKRRTLMQRDHETICAAEEELQAVAISWLLEISPVQDVVATAIQSIGSLNPTSTTLSCFRKPDLDRIHNHVCTWFVAVRAGLIKPFQDSSSSISYARYMRTLISLISHDLPIARFDAVWLYFRDVFSGRVSHVTDNHTRARDPTTLTRLGHPIDAPYDIPLLELLLVKEFKLMWDMDTLSDIRQWNMDIEPRILGHATGKAIAVITRGRLPLSRYLAVKVLEHGRSTTYALRFGVHLFHAGHMSELPEAELALVVKTINALMDNFSTTHTSPVAAAVEIWCHILVSYKHLGLSDDDAIIVADDLGTLTSRFLTGIAIPQDMCVAQCILKQLVIVVVSPGYPRARWTVRTISHTVHMFMSVDSTLRRQRGIDGNETKPLCPAQEYLCALTCLLGGLARAPLTNHASSSKATCATEVARAICWLYDPHIMHESLSDADLISMLKLILSASDDGSSAWRLLHNFCCEQARLFEVSCVIAQYLSIAQKKGLIEETKGLVDEFFAVDWIIDCVRWYQTSCNGDMRGLEFLIRQCNSFSDAWKNIEVVQFAPPTELGLFLES